MKLTNGSTYLVIIQETVTKRTGWLVQQTGQKSWVATRFTHATQDYNREYTVLLGNSLKVSEELSKRGDLQVIATSDTPTLRKYMFNVLKYGQFEAQDES